MGLRHFFYRWLIPAAFVLPLWLLIGWIVFGANPWALLWVFISGPIVLVWQLVVTLLVRARGTVRAERAVSWTDVALFGAWHLAIVALGVFDARWWWPVLGLTIVLGIALLWVALWQLLREARPSVVLSTVEGYMSVPPQRPARPSSAHDVIVVEETRHDS
ncbi:hypothetical protein [Microbacterium sp. No. 7]|uniref:hypothetical protein n=1 Tax=Microbacterium sp. No. 7 TaxID=1714373 RepID=UPI0006CF32E9|nr:hypothetical protein [Microbacterium sp. No. 7]ALJ20330.1 MFS transporter permease [Microbacterium sp. No. 7]